MRSLGGEMRAGGLLEQRPEPEPEPTPKLVRMTERPVDGDETVPAWGWDFPRGVTISGCQVRVDPNRGIVLWVLEDGSATVYEAAILWDQLDARTSGRRS